MSLLLQIDKLLLNVFKSGRLNYLCFVELLNFIFRLGVLFAIYGFLWGLIEIAIAILSAGRKRSTGEVYVIRALKYFFLADVTFLFCIEGAETNELVVNQVIMAGIILLTYFVGKFQNNQNKNQLFRMMGPGMPNMSSNFNARAELFVIGFAIAIFSAFWFFPQYASNPLSLWFHESIINIEDTPVFGFIFKVIGFFFLLNLFNKMASGFSFLLSGEAFKVAASEKGNGKRKNENDFDDFTEVE